TRRCGELPRRKYGAPERDSGPRPVQRPGPAAGGHLVRPGVQLLAPRHPRAPAASFRSVPRGDESSSHQSRASGAEHLPVALPGYSVSPDNPEFRDVRCGRLAVALPDASVVQSNGSDRYNKLKSLLETDITGGIRRTSLGCATIREESSLSELGKRIGRRIRELRTQRPERWTQEDLAERAKISVSFLSMIERGKRVAHVETLAALADSLGVSLAELFVEPAPAATNGEEL